MGNSDFRKYTCKAEFDKALFTLKGLLDGILIDNKINQNEIDELLNWLSINEALEKYKPFDSIIECLKNILQDGYIDSDEKEDLVWLSMQFSEQGKYYDVITKSLQILHGICHGILADNRINEDEIAGLLKWVNEHDFLEGTYPYDELRALISSMLADMVITEDELNKLKAFMGEFIDCTKSYNVSQKEIDKLKELYDISGVCALDPIITIKDHQFCFTGESSKATRKEIEEIILANGGHFVKSVSKKTDFLIVGSKGNEAWAFSCYGRKVEKALEIRKAGGKVMIVKENNFWSVV